MVFDNSYLYHVSEQCDIAVFNPRPSPRPKEVPGNLVWAVNAERLINYLLPRDCPRVTYFAAANTSEEDYQKFIGSRSIRAVIAVEKGWLARILATKLYVYCFMPADFVLQDNIAGYYITSKPQVPHKVVEVNNPLLELATYDIELRILPSLIKLRDQVISSTLGFSCIRMQKKKK